MSARKGSRRRVWVGGELLLALAVLLSACGEEPAPEAETPPEAPAEPAIPDRVLDAAWAPDGERLAVTWERGLGGARIFGLLAGTDSTPAEAGRGLPLSPGRGAWPTWSPDGLWIAYESGGDLHRMRPDGTFEEAVLSTPAAESHPAWSPDGRRLAYVAPAAQGGPPVLWLAGADGSDPSPLPVAVQAAWTAPVWHPAGEALAATGVAGGDSAVYRVDPTEGSAVRLVSGSGPAFSPTGDTLWFARGDTLFSLPWEGGEAAAPEAVLTPGRAPAPAPDGVRLAFLRGNPPGEALYVLHLETGEVRRLSAPLPPRGPDRGRTSPPEGG